MLKVFIVTLSALMSGCIYVPINEPEPYEKEKLTEIHPGVTSREEIIEIIGNPSVVRDDNSIWIYAEARHLYLFIFLAGRFSMDFVDEYQFIVLEFNRDTLKSVELVEDQWGCSSTGVCLHSGWNYSKQLDEDQTIIYSKREDDHRAKEFQSGPNECPLYIYSTGGEAIGGRLFVEIDAEPTTAISSSVFLYSKVHPGDHDVTFRTVFGEAEKQEISCTQGEIFFIELHLDRIHKFSFRPRLRHEVHPKLMDHDDGSNAIKNRQLLLRP